MSTAVEMGDRVEPVPAGWRRMGPSDYVAAQREASALRDWDTLLFLNNAWCDPRVVLEAPCDRGEILPGIWRGRCVDAGAGDPCHLLRIWIMVAGHPDGL